MKKVTFTPIGVIRTPFKTRDDAPIQPSRAEGARGTVEIRPDLAEGLEDLDGFSHITLIYHLHLSKSFKLKVIPYLDDVPRGVFATRAPRRPNQIGVSVVRLIKIEGTVLHIENVDMLDGTPLLDIKPYVPGFVDQAEVRSGWLEDALRRDKKKK
ncbi:MAG: tRNA (N6-threonylcarbamoyladenosine(37)-N6)-methyltransferase TrmO [Candidatus Latescibacterota bacterium]|nr:MAG: tRNA (N6-threonylcarbamoyladenosine(37)-N6)-methyltransferase TrmO [Candidatus Latescibacterota bacterium]